MSDLSVLAGLTESILPNKNGNLLVSYLQMMDIDVWRLRTEKRSFNKLMVLIDGSTISASGQILFRQMLRSIGLNLSDVIMKYTSESSAEILVSSSEVSAGLSEKQEQNYQLTSSGYNKFFAENNLNFVGVILVIGDNLTSWCLQNSNKIDGQDFYHDIPIFFMEHPDYLLLNSACKKNVYLKLLQIKEFI